MTGSDYQHGDMDITNQKKTWGAFIQAATFATLLIMLLLGYITLVFAMGMNWAVALGLTLIAGGLAGFFMNMGVSWVITMGTFAVTVIIVRILMAIFGALM